MDRRRFLKVGLGGASAAALARRLGIGFDAAVAASPPVTPFAQPLAIPDVATPASTTGGIDHYEIEMRTSSVQIVSGRSTTIYGYDGRFPGPTIEATVGRPVSVGFTNSLAVPTAIHLHGGNVEPQHDGHPLDVIEPGDRRLYQYPNAQRSATLWYHDHAMDRTAENVYRGLAGLYLLRDPADDALGLPEGDRDVPLLIQDRAFETDWSLSYPSDHDPRRHDGVTGDVYLVNGVPFPTFAVERGRYRLRLINGSNTRAYELRLAGRSMQQIASDGGLLAAPVTVPSITLGVAERAEIVVDFSTFDAGSSVELQDAISGRAIMRFDVGSSGATGGTVPSTLRTIEALPAPARTRDVRLSFDQAADVWLVNGQRFDPSRIEFRPRLGTTEAWRITNESSFVHPFHLHLVQFQVRKRGLANAPANERGWKDTVRVAPGETVELAARFTGYTGTYVFHCHVLEHEDHSMMAQMRVVDLPRVAGADRAATAAAISAASFDSGTTEVFIATGSVFADALGGGPAASALAAPILLSVGASLSAATRIELERLSPTRITVLGGASAVPDAIERELATYATVRRVAGADRYETAALLSELVPDPTIAYVASGTSFADALAGGAAAAYQGGVLLLTTRDELPATTASALRELKPERIEILGGTAAVSSAVEAQLVALDAGTVRRRAGDDRYATASAIADAAFASPTTVYVATGASFGDALAATPAAAAERAPLLLTLPDVLPLETAALIERWAPARIVIVGGTSAVSASVEDALAGML